jgi:hypothetical protein
MAAAAVLSSSALSLPPGSKYEPLISNLPSKAEKKLKNHDAFSPAKHLSFMEPPKVIMMEDIGMSPDKGISPVAVSEPFQLFTEEAIMRMREEVLSKEVFDNCQFSSNLAHCQLRGFANK